MNAVVTALAQSAMPEPDKPRGVVAALSDFFSREAGQRRRQGLNESLSGAADYFLGPTGIPQRLNALGILNPVNDMEQASQNALAMTAPGATGQERFNAGVNMLTDVATVVAPAYAASRVGTDGAAALVDSLTGIGQPTRQGLQDAGQRFAVDESGAINVDAIKARFPDVDLSVSGTPERGYTVNKIVVPADQRGQGVGSDVMREVLRQADADGATVALTPSKDFGGSVPRLRDFYSNFGFVQNKGKNRDFGISEDMYRLPQQPPSKADEIARMLREGRANEITDDMMAALGPNDQMRLFQLYEEGATGVPMPMDEASRMARAREMGFDTGTPLYHGTGADFAAFDMSKAGTGPITKNEIANHGVFTTPMADYTDIYGDIKIPVVARSGNYKEVDMFSTKNGMTTPQGVMDPELVKKVVGASKAKGDAGMSLGSRGVEWERMVYDPRNIRSRFARFDPRLKHLANLSAGIGGVAMLTPEEEAAEIRAYLDGIQ